MDSSENDEAQETPTSPSEARELSPADAMVRDIEAAEHMHERHDDAPQREVDLADEEGFPPKPTVAPTPEPVHEPAPPAEPGLYYCDEDDPGVHPVLGQLYHGENDFVGVTHPEMLQALGELVAAGVLRKD